ncbi:hypothetical protein GCM10010109_20210 [Actinoplanes campanulatus]|nr:hypothetical protein GCM10010109_20210 [Actinoplanes campanulatus]
MVEGERHPLVAQVGDHGERVVEPVVGEPVGAVAEPQAAHVVTSAALRRRHEFTTEPDDSLASSLIENLRGNPRLQPWGGNGFPAEQDGESRFAAEADPASHPWGSSEQMC